MGFVKNSCDINSHNCDDGYKLIKDLVCSVVLKCCVITCNGL